ncbi:sugar transferase [Flavobacterium lacisediminis]|uniref:Sugar transferase n=1 Tax=Flavobacterium lacisediminis TaxID=2989705 RepID=A0ABT3EHF0_9FLAO|nr:sugar transferase [Flavobacterium lacisediminis]MCW1147864.1 sugar transferase [Flavobacterium lacisediminis]
MYQNGIKIVLDKIVALMAFLFVSPIFIIVVSILFFYQKKVFFIQTRVGKDQKRFFIYKFQTMSDERDSNGKLLPDDDRISSFGKFLRATSLDELPQLINVLKGNMSLVGPRPLLTDYAHLYSDYQNKRHQVLPGITGYVQVKGRNALTWEERFDLDVYYVQHISFLFDCKILFLTFITLFDFKKSRPQNGISIEPFEGQW